jgi:hypothetical protein
MQFPILPYNSLLKKSSRASCVFAGNSLTRYWGGVCDPSIGSKKPQKNGQARQLIEVGKIPAAQLYHSRAATIGTPEKNS